MGLPQPGTTNYSEETAEIIDQEIKVIIDTQYQVAKDILVQHQEVLKKGAEMVLKEEAIEGEQLKKLLQKDN